MAEPYVNTALIEMSEHNVCSENSRKGQTTRERREKEQSCQKP